MISARILTPFYLVPKSSQVLLKYKPHYAKYAQNSPGMSYFRLEAVSHITISSFLHIIFLTSSLFQPYWPPCFPSTPQECSCLTFSLLCPLPRKLPEKPHCFLPQFHLYPLSSQPDLTWPSYLKLHVCVHAQIWWIYGCSLYNLQLFLVWNFS